MSIFAPAYRPTSAQRSYFTLEQKQDRKRKRTSDFDGDGLETPLQQSPELDEVTPRTATTAFHPVNNTDPYYVAGHARELPLPPAPFPHAAVLGREHAKGKTGLDDELAGLNPPVYAPRREPETSLKRQHVDNLTAVLHRCMLRGDWQRASRAWSLLLRTEIAGRGIDVRQNGRWGIGAEILMRRHAATSNHDDSEEGDGETASRFSDHGFQLARQYYERLTLQYPHTPRSQHNINATAFYPALFNIWVYEVQARSQRALQKLPTERRGSTDSDRSDVSSLRSQDRESMLAIRKRELEEAIPIAQRLDELLLSPPYDTSLSLLHLRGMMGLWILDLHARQTESRTLSSDDEAGSSRYSSRLETDQSRNAADVERRKALRLLRKVKDGGGQVPASVLELVANESEAMSD